MGPQPKEASPWWLPDKHTDRRDRLLARNAIKKALRRWFEAERFTEVECGIAQVSPGNEAHLHAFATEVETPAGGECRRFLHTSPEFACKKLLAAGERRIFDFARVFRNRELGTLHAPEFTMLEWYRAEEPYASVMADCISVLRLAAETTGIRQVSWRRAECDPRAEPERISVCEAFRRFSGIDLAKTLTDEGEGLRDRLAAAAYGAGILPAIDDTWSDIFSKILVARVERELGRGRPSLLYEYPRNQAALARPTRHDPRFAERFELYVCGVELANGFGELTDAKEQRSRFEAEMAVKERVYGKRYPIDEDFLVALAHMPEASGVALGFDRLVMLVTASRSVDDVIWTPFPQ